MSITVNNLGPNSVEIRTIGENADAIWSSVYAFINQFGWTLESTHSGNGAGYRIISIAQVDEQGNSIGSASVRVNLIDMTLTPLFGSIIERSHGYPTSADTAFMRNHIDHIKNIATDNILTSSLNITAGPGNSFQLNSSTTANLLNYYEGQSLKVVGTSGSYAGTVANCFVRDILDNSIRIEVNANDTYASVLEDVSIFAPKVVYTGVSNPTTIYISASEKHIAIQVKAPDGRYHDYSAVCQVETVPGSNVPSRLIGTTAFMNSRGGSHLNLLQTSAYAMAQSYSLYNHAYLGNNTTDFDYKQLNLPQYNRTFSSGNYYAVPPSEVIGPFAIAKTPYGNTSEAASLGAKLATPFGEAGIVGGEQNYGKSLTDPTGTSNVNLSIYMFSKIYYRGLGDLVPSDTAQYGGSALVFSPYCSVDNMYDLNESLKSHMRISDQFYVNPSSALSSYIPQVRTASTNAYLYGGASGVLTAGSTNSGAQNFSGAMMLGRPYNMLVASTGLLPGSVISADVDSNGFASAGATPKDHLIFAYEPSDSVYSNNLQRSITDFRWSQSMISKILTSRRGAVAFPL